MSLEVPSGWSGVVLADLFELNTPGFWGTDDGDGVDALVLRSTNFRKDGKLNYATAARRRFPIKKLLQKELRFGDILLERSGGSPAQPVGRAAYFEGGSGYSASNFMQILRPRIDYAEAKYIFYWMDFTYAQGRTESLQKATTGIRNLDFGSYMSLPVALPPLDEQRRIAEILSSVDEAIQATQAVIEQTRTVKQGVLERLLTKGIGHTRFKQTEIGEIPESWTVCTVGGVIRSIDAGWSPDCETEAATDGEWGVLKTSAVVWEGYRPVENKRLRPGLQPRPEIEVDAGDVLVTRAGPVERTGVIAYVNATPKQLMLSDKIIRLKADEQKCLPRFLAYSLSGNTAQSQVVSHKSGMALSQTNISQKSLLTVSIAVPSIDEQDQICDCLQATDDYLREASRAVSGFMVLKSALMADLLTGRVRVPTALSAAAE